MRATILVAGAALGLMACGGDKAAEKPAETPAAAPAAAGATHEVAMDFDGKVGKFTPDKLTIKAGDVVRFVVKSGPPHNVAFDAAGIPAGADAVLNAAMTDAMAPLMGPMEIEIGGGYDVSFAGAPAGTYKYFCTPHVPFGMKAELTVE